MVVSLPNYRSSAGVQLTESRLIADLSEHADALLNQQDISDLLTDEQERKIAEYVKACAEMSYHQVSKRYGSWLEADRAHDVYVPPDTTEFREKAVIPDTRAIADTVLTYMMAATTGRNPMFQLEGLNRQSRNAALILERVIHQHMRRGAGEANIAQVFLDGIRYGFAPTKVVFDPKTNSNRIVNFDPRRVFPDPRVNWGDWENMQFIVATDYVSTNALMATGLYPKLNKYPALQMRDTVPRQGNLHHHSQKDFTQGLSVNPNTQTNHGGHTNDFLLGPARVVDECWMRLQGWEIGIPRLGQVYLVATVLDEGVVIRFQLNPYGQQYPWVIGGLYHDVHKHYGQSLYDLLMPMHDISTYLLRSRIDNISAALNNLIFADPTKVMIPDLIDRNPWGIVRTLPGNNPGDGIFIAQVPDVTRSHLGDISNLNELKQRVSAASDAQQGVPTPDVRTATEIQRLTQLGSQRLGVLARLSSATTIRPMVRMMVANIQDSLEAKGAIRMDPSSMPQQLASLTQDGYLDFDSQMITGDIDYLVIDGTLPLEPTRNAETWMSMIQVMNQTGLQMEYDVGQIAEEAIRSMGISDLDRFRISEEARQQGLSPSQQMAMAQADRGATGKTMPNEDVQRQVERGNLIPMSEARR